jgi:hypothetical protein
LAPAPRDDLVEFFREVRQDNDGAPDEPDETGRFSRDLLPLGS